MSDTLRGPDLSEFTVMSLASNLPLWIQSETAGDSGHQPEDIAGLPAPVDELLHLEHAVPHGLRAVRGLVSGNKGFALGD